MLEFPITLFSFAGSWYRRTDVIPGNTAACIYLHRAEIEAAAEKFFLEECTGPYKGRFELPNSVREAVTEAIASERLIKHGLAKSMLLEAETLVERRLRDACYCDFRNIFENRLGFLVFINTVMTAVENKAWALRSWFGAHSVAELIDVRESVGSEHDRICSGVKALVRAYRTGAESPEECSAIEKILPVLKSVRGFGGNRSALFVRSIVNELRQEILRASAFSQQNRVIDERFIAEYGFYFFRDKLLQIVNVKRCRQTAA